MRTMLTAVLLVSGLACVMVQEAEAFHHHTIRTRCIAYYPGLYSFGYCGAPCPPPPYTFPCTYSYPKYHGPFASCYDGRVLCTTGQCGNRYSGCGYGSGFGYGRWTCGNGCGCGRLCRVRGNAACGYSCDGYACGGCDSCGSGCTSGTCSNCDAGASTDSTTTDAESTNDMLPSSDAKTDTSAGASTKAIRSFKADEKVLYDGPADKAPKLNGGNNFKHVPTPSNSPEMPPTPPLPAEDPSTSIFRQPFRLVSKVSQDAEQGSGLREFTRGMQAYRDNNMTQALEAFESAVAVEPSNPLYAYYRALSLYNLHGPDAANDWLAEAVQLESVTPIAQWGRHMERVQGRPRLWVEKARAAAGVGR